MASGKDVRAGKAHVELGVRDRLQAGLKRAQARLKKFAAGISAVGAATGAVGSAILAPFAAALPTFLSVGDAMGKMSARTGVSVEALSQLKHAAEQSGSSVDGLEKGFRGMARFSFDLERGLSTATDVADELGLSFDDLAGKTPEEQMLSIADRLKGIDDPGKRAALAMKVFGKSGAEMLPMLNQGADGIRALMAEADALGLTMRGEDAKAAEELTDALNILKEQFTAIQVKIGAAVAPALTALAKRIAPVVTWVINWLDQNRALVRQVALVGAIIFGVGAALTFFGGLAFAASLAIGGLISVIGFASAVVGVLGAVIGVIASPVGLAVAAVLAAVAAFFSFTAVGRSMAGIFGETMAGIWATFQSTFGGIANALKAGDLGLAAQIAWTGLQAAFWQGLAGIAAVVDLFGSDTLGGMASALMSGQWLNAARLGWIELKSIFVEGAVAIEQAWSMLTIGLANMLDGAITSIRKKWTDASGWLAKQILTVQGFFDKSLDVEMAQRFVDEDSARTKSRLDAGRDGRESAFAKMLDDRLRGSESRVSAIDAERRNLLAEIETQADGGPQHRAAEALANLNRLLADAQAAADNAPAVLGIGGKDDQEQQAVRSFSSGTFQGRNLDLAFRSLGGSVEEKQLETQKQIAAASAETAKTLRRGQPLVFA